MSLSIKNNNKKSSLSSLSSSSTTTKTRALLLHKNSAIKTSKTSAARITTSTPLLSPSVEVTSNLDVVSSSSTSTTSSAISLMSMMKQQLSSSSSSSSVELLQVTEAGASAAFGRKVFRTMPSFKIMSYQNFIALLTVLMCGLVTINGLKCYMCGQYNEGVGSITPCLNYSEQYAHLYLKECSKKSEKYCVKYVSELSIVRDCATECAEKEIWETQTYCCTEDGCNGSSTIEASTIVIMLPLVFYIVSEILNIFKQRR